MTIVIFLYKDGLPCYNSRIYGHRTTGKEYLMAKTADTIAIYSRKSRYTGKGESIGNQIDLCREYIRTHYGDAAAEHAVVFEDEGFSGGNLNRPDFKKMMTAAKDRKFKAIVVYRLDRISRNISDFSSLIEELGRQGIKTKAGRSFTRFSIKSILQNPVYLIADKDAYQYFVDNEAELFAPESDFDSLPDRSQEKRQALLHKLQ